MELIIDSREAKILEILDNLKINYQKRNLDIGDISITNHDNTIILFERKTHKDLVSSLKDGRYKEQKVRILNELNNKRIKKCFYILEGSRKDIKQYEYNSVLGVKISCELRDNISILETKDPLDTTKLILKFFDRLKGNKNKEFNFLLSQNNQSQINQINQSNLSDSNNQSNTNNISNNYLNKQNNRTKEIIIKDTIGQSNYCDNIKIKKKDNLTPLNCQIAALMVCPGVSSNIATKIINKYKSIHNLFNEYLKNEEFQDLSEEEKKIKIKEKNENLLKDIIINDKGRKLGISISKKIYNNFFNN